jgi:alcohol dehydrogenase class IV
VNFEFATAARIVFGRGAIKQLPALASSYGRRIFLVTGLRQELVDKYLEQLFVSDLEIHNFHVTGEPTVERIEEARQRAWDFQPELVIGLGGGSAIDSAKAVAALATNTDPIHTYLEVIGENQPLMKDPLPLIAVPTTSGTGAEVTRNAVIGSKQHRVKVSLRHVLMLPRIALIDPEVTISLPPDVTAYTGLDALTQVIEPYVSRNSNPLTDCLCREGIQRGSRALLRACQDGADLEAREEMALTSLLGGMALANAKLGAVHGIAGPFGGMVEAPHGAICGRLLPAVMKTNIKALQASEPQNPALGRYTELARWLTGEPGAVALDGANWASELIVKLEIPGLSSYGFAISDIDKLVRKSQSASSMKGNPLELSDDELRMILEEAL